MNFFMLFATSAASFILVIGRRFEVKSLIATYGWCEIEANRKGFVEFTFDCQGEHPTSLERGSDNRVDDAR